MKEVNKNTEIDNIDKKLHISDVINSKIFLFKVYDLPDRKLYFLLSDETPKKGDWVFDTHSLGWDKTSSNKKYNGIYKIISSTIPMLDKSLPVMEYKDTETPKEWDS